MNTLEKELSVSSLEYNAARSKMFIPEYGRHLQKLIDLAVIVEDKTERNKMANYIIKIMGTLNPHLRDVADFQHKLWDQLFIMSNFKLDVDSPFPIPTEDVVHLKPEKLNYPQKFPKYRYYGNHIKSMIDIAMNWKDENTKDALIVVVANHMKKCYLSWNKDTVEDSVIYDHLLELSNGTINLHNREKGLTNSFELMKVNQKISNKNTPPAPQNQNSYNKFKQNSKNKNGTNNNNSIQKKPFINNNNPKA
jgi:Domain of unknown function (DUF4290)